MFRVDPAFKQTAIFAHIQGKAVEEYYFLQLTKPQPVWIVHFGKEHRERYWFTYLPHALDACRYSHGPAVYIMLPEYISATGKLTTTLVERIYECRKGVRKERRFEITTESGVYRFNEFGYLVRKTVREKIVFTS